MNENRQPSGDQSQYAEAAPPQETPVSQTPEGNQVVASEQPAGNGKLLSAVEKFGVKQEAGVTAKPEYSSTSSEQQQLKLAAEARGLQLSQRINSKGQLESKFINSETGQPVSEDQMRATDPILADQFDRLATIAKAELQNPEKRREVMRSINGPGLAERVSEKMKGLWKKVGGEKLAGIFTKENLLNFEKSPVRNLIAGAGERMFGVMGQMAEWELNARKDRQETVAKTLLESQEKAAIAAVKAKADAEKRTAELAATHKFDLKVGTGMSQAWLDFKVRGLRSLADSVSNFLNNDPLALREKASDMRAELKNKDEEISKLDAVIEQLKNDLIVSGVAPKELGKIGAVTRLEKNRTRVQKQADKIQFKQNMLNRFLNATQKPLDSGEGALWNVYRGPKNEQAAKQDIISQNAVAFEQNAQPNKEIDDASIENRPNTAVAA